MPTTIEPKRTIVLVDGESLPTATVDNYLYRAIVQSTGNPDREYVCMRDAGGSYAWLGAITTDFGGTRLRQDIAVKDGSFAIENTSDLTKIAVFDASALATGTTRTYKLPDASSGLAVVDTGYVTPPGPVAIDAAAVTSLAAGQTAARYLGMVPASGITAVELNVAVATAVATSIVWAEVALATANSATGGNLTRIGAVTSVTGSFNSTGVKTVTISTGVPAGAFLYALFGSSATTPFQLRATIADELGVGVVRLATARPSTMASATAFVTSTATTGAVWCLARWS